MSRWQIWINDETLAGHVDADSEDIAMEVAVYHVRGFFGGDVPLGTEWSVCEIPPGYYETLAKLNRSAGFDARTDF